MTDTPDIIAKKADGQEILNDLVSLVAKLEAMKTHPHWFAGLPETLIQTRNIAEHHARAIRENFNLPAPE